MPPPVTIVDTPPPAAPPAPTKSILVSSMPAPAAPPAEPKKGSAMDRMRDSLRAKAGNGSMNPTAPVPQSTAAPPAADAADSTPTRSTEPAAPPGGEPSKTPADSPPSPTPVKKPTLGQVLDQYKAKAAALEKEVADLKNNVVPEAERKTLNERLKQFETRNKELEDEIRYINFQKSAEFKEKYEVPYQNAWKRAMSDLSDIKVSTGDGERNITGDDILELVNMPRARAKEVARQLFGDDAEDVMQHRTEIKRLLGEQTQALKEAREKGAERENARQEEFKRTTTEIQDYIKSSWEKTNATAHADPKYGTFFKPIEGDEQGNQRLAKGFELVQRAFSEDPRDPRLTTEQRLSIIKRHAAVHNRAAGFGRVAYWLEQERAAHAETKKRLQEYQSSVPSTGGQDNQRSPVSSANGRAWDQVRADLAKRAR